jgi:hypothetical protein
MRKPEKSAIEKSVVIAICSLLVSQRRSRRWLADELGMDYGSVKRLLRCNSRQALTISTAERMLNLLGSDLRTVIVAPVIKELRDKLLETFDGYC